MQTTVTAEIEPETESGSSSTNTSGSGASARPGEFDPAALASAPLGGTDVVLSDDFDEIEVPIDDLAAWPASRSDSFLHLYGDVLTTTGRDR